MKTREKLGKPAAKMDLVQREQLVEWFKAPRQCPLARCRTGDVMLPPSLDVKAWRKAMIDGATGAHAPRLRGAAKLGCVPAATW